MSAKNAMPAPTRRLLAPFRVSIKSKCDRCLARAPPSSAPCTVRGAPSAPRSVSQNCQRVSGTSDKTNDLPASAQRRRVSALLLLRPSLSRKARRQTDNTRHLGAATIKSNPPAYPTLGRHEPFAERDPIRLVRHRTSCDIRGSALVVGVQEHCDEGDSHRVAGRQTPCDARDSDHLPLHMEAPKANGAGHHDLRHLSSNGNAERALPHVGSLREIRRGNHLDVRRVTRRNMCNNKATNERQVTRWTIKCVLSSLRQGHIGMRMEMENRGYAADQNFRDGYIHCCILCVVARK